MTMVTPRYVTGNSPVRYTAAVENAWKMPRVGKNPLIVKAVEITQDNRIVIAADAAERIAKATREGMDFLDQGRVVIALD